jgi:hypothetical protein
MYFSAMIICMDEVFFSTSGGGFWISGWFLEKSGELAIGAYEKTS